MNYVSSFTRQPAGSSGNIKKNSTQQVKIQTSQDLSETIAASNLEDSNKGNAVVNAVKNLNLVEY